MSVRASREGTAALVLPGRFRGAVFDLDGLLIDSEPGWGRAEAELFRRHGLAYTEDERLATLGRSVDEVIAALAARLGLPAESGAGLRRELMDLVAAEYVAGHPILPGAMELIARLRNEMPLAVASNTDRALVEASLAVIGVADAFQAVITAQDVARAKPAPDIYLLACQRLGVEPGDAVAFEDSDSGVRAARAAGLTVVAVPQLEGLSLEGADIILGSLEELLELE
jgi:HAD superfamily hydrolase (TIGR01509 family)